MLKLDSSSLFSDEGPQTSDSAEGWHWRFLGQVLDLGFRALGFRVYGLGLGFWVAFDAKSLSASCVPVVIVCSWLQV